MARVFTFRGKTIEELQALSALDFSKLIGARERRSIKRMGTNYKMLIKKVEAIKKKDPKKAIKTHTREAIILPGWVGLRFGVYNGKEFKDLYVAEPMIGHRLGEFVFSTKRVLHSAPGIRATRGSKFLAVK